MLLWGVGTAGEGYISSASTTYFSIFLTDVIGMSVGLSGTVLLFQSIISFVVATIAGAIIGTTKPMKWGRLRSWLLVAPPFCAIFYILQFGTPSKNMVVNAVFMIIAFAIGCLGFNLAYTSNISLTNVIARNQGERNAYNSQRMMGSNTGRLMGNYLTPILVAALTAKFTERYSYPIIVAIAGVFFITMELIQFGLAKGREQEFYEENNLSDDNLKLKDIVDILKTNRQLLITLIIDLTSNIASIALPTLAAYYYRNVIEKPLMVSTHMLCIGLAGLGGAFFVRLVGKKITKYKGYLLCVYLIISALLFSTKLVQGNAYAFLGINVIVHFLTGTTTPFEMNLYQDNVIYSEYLTGVSATSLVMGLTEIPVKVAGILKSVILTFALTTAGYVAGAAPTQALKDALSNCYAFIPGCIPIIGFIFLLFFYKLTPEKLEGYKEEIRKRNHVE